MILLANAMIGVAYLLNSVIWIVQILVIARVIVSWVGADPYNRLVQFITSSTEPMLAPIRRRIGVIGGGIDLSPIILLFGVIFLQYALVASLQEYALQIKMGAMQPNLPTRSF